MIPALGPELNDSQRKQLHELIAEFHTTFSTKLGRAVDVEMKINTGDAPPVHLPAYRVGAEKKAIIREEIKVMLEAGVIQPSMSPWASPAIVVPKPDGKWRLCIDYRRLNRTGSLSYAKN